MSLQIQCVAHVAFHDRFLRIAGGGVFGNDCRGTATKNVRFTALMAGYGLCGVRGAVLRNVVDDVVCFDFGRKVRDYICEWLIVSGVLALTLVATAF